MVYQDFSLDSPRFVLGATLQGTFNECSNKLPSTLVKMDDPSVLEFLYKEVFGNQVSKDEK